MLSADNATLLKLGKNLLLPGMTMYSVSNSLSILGSPSVALMVGSLTVPKRGFDGKAFTQIFLDGLGLGRRLDDD